MTAPHGGARGRAAARPEAQGTADAAHPACPADGVHDAKTQSTYAALLALHGGYTLHELAAGGFLICRWNMHHHVADLAGVRAFLASQGLQV